MGGPVIEILVEPYGDYAWTNGFGQDAAGEFATGNADAPGPGEPPPQWWLWHQGARVDIPTVGHRWTPIAVTHDGTVLGSRGYGWGYYSDPARDGLIFVFSAVSGVTCWGGGNLDGASTDGSVAAGYYWPVYGDLDTAPCWWGSDGVRHELPTTGGFGRAMAVSGDGLVIYGLDREEDWSNARMVKWIAGQEHDLPQMPSNTGRVVLSPDGNWAMRCNVGSDCWDLWRDDALICDVPMYFDGLSGGHRWFGVANTGRVCGMWSVPQVDPDVDPWYYAVIWEPGWARPVTLFEAIPESLREDWHSLETARSIDATGMILVGTGQQWRDLGGELPERVALAFRADLRQVASQQSLAPTPVSRMP